MLLFCMCALMAVHQHAWAPTLLETPTQCLQVSNYSIQLITEQIYCSLLYLLEMAECLDAAGLYVVENLERNLTLKHYNAGLVWMEQRSIKTPCFCFLKRN